MSTSHFILSDAERAFLQRQRVGRLATADEEGHPTVVPVCYAFEGQHFSIALDEKPKSVSPYQLKRVRNIQARGEASLLIDHYSEDWSQLAYVLIAGKAEIIEPGHPLHKRTLELVRARYVQYETMRLEEMPVIAIAVEKVRSWGKI